MDKDQLILGFIDKYGPVTRSKLVLLTGFPRTTVYDTLQRLIRAGKIEAFSEERDKVGHPKTFYKPKGEDKKDE